METYHVPAALIVLPFGMKIEVKITTKTHKNLPEKGRAVILFLPLNWFATLFEEKKRTQ